MERAVDVVPPCSRLENNDGDDAGVGHPETDQPEAGKSEAGQNSPTKSMASSGSSSEEEYLPLPADGGYGWVIVIASFLINGLVDGMCGSFGVIMPAFIDYFQATRAKTALAGSLMTGFFLISGPVVGVLVNLYGCRKISMLGGVITAFSIAISRLSSTIEVLILFYGVCAGIGIGMMYLPAMVMVGYYFERRRALAMGIACSGSGLGIFLLAPSYALTISHFDWKNTMLIIAGIALQGTVFGALMRPYSGTTSQGTSPSSSEISDISETKVLLKNNTPANTVQVSIVKCSDVPEQEEAATKEAALEDSRGDMRVMRERCHTGDQSVQLYRKAMQNVLRQRLYSESQQDEHNLPAASQDVYSKMSTPSNLTAAKNDLVNPPKGQLLAMTQSLYELPHQSHKPSHRHLQPYAASPQKHLTVSCYELSHDGHREKRHLHHEEKRLIREALLKPMNRMDIFYQGSITTLPEYQSQPNLSSYITSITNIPELQAKSDRSPCPCVDRGMLATLVDMMDMSILASPPFLIISLASIFIQIAYFIPIVFIMDYAATVGIEAQKASTLVSAIGLSNAIGRAVCGGLANLQCVRPLHLNNVCLLLAGVVTILAVFVCQNYASLLVFAISYGFFIAAFVPLTTLFLVEYLGLARLTNAFGLISMVRGLATMAGPPIAGLLLDVTSSYQWTFTFAGVMVILSGFVYYLLPLTNKFTSNEERVPLPTVLAETTVDEGSSV